ncbi:Collagen alpha-1 chain [Camelus dromedarius]|uniref:Collagen alpha-1 chain n=1 Tax=Camelus dromedarius TaxID=9838 RepID=A0A5N4CIK4_CAMDR|nr:Collagen alpha-1 chain [Camelus dromedarius]
MSLEDLLLTLCCLRIAVAGMECLTRAEADVVLLVDGSWSLSRANLRTVRSLISHIVEVCDWPQKGAALAQYSGDPRTEWQLNAHRDKKSLLQAVVNLLYKGAVPSQFYVSWLESSTVLTDVKPDTECRVDGSSVVEDEHSEVLKGTEKT